MRTTMMAAVSGSLILALAGTANAACSNRTIRGDYASILQGSTLSADGTTVTGLINGVGVFSFDGNGNLAQEDFVVINAKQVPGGSPNASGFQGNKVGTYSINSDCTGNLTIQIAPGNERNLALVVANNGNTIHAVGSGATVNGSPANVQTRTDFERIAPRD